MVSNNPRILVVPEAVDLYRGVPCAGGADGSTGSVRSAITANWVFAAVLDPNTGLTAALATVATPASTQAHI